MMPLNEEDDAALDALEVELQLSTTDPFLSALNALRGNGNGASNPARPRVLPINESASAPQLEHTTSRGYMKTDPTKRWSFYVVFSGPGAGIYRVW